MSISVRSARVVATMLATVGVICGTGAAKAASATTIPNPVIQYVTRYVSPSGQVVVRHVSSLVEVPTLIDINGDGRPDVVGTLSLESTSKFQLTFTRVTNVTGLVGSGVGLFPTPGLNLAPVSPSKTDPLPALVEVVVADPTGSLPRQRINFGFDSTGGVTPARWSAVATIGGTSAKSTLDVSTTTVGAGSTLATVGGLFNGSDVLTPTDPISGKVQYTPVPPNANLGMTTGSAPEIRAGASKQTQATASLREVQGSDTQTFSVDVSSLPQSMMTAFSSVVSGTSASRSVTYSASGAIPAPAQVTGQPPQPSVAINYSDASGSTITTQAVANAYGIPTGMTLMESGTVAPGATSPTFSGASFTTSGGSLGRVDVAFANGPTHISASSNPFLSVVDEPASNVVSGRVDQLTAASITVSNDDSVTAAATVGNGEEPMDIAAHLQDASTGRTLDLTGHISNVPAQLNVVYGPSQGQFVYNASGATINEVDASVSSNQPLFGQVKNLTASIFTLPSNLTVSFAAPAGAKGAKVTATGEDGSPERVGEIEATLTDGVVTPAAIPAGQDGATIIDTTGATPPSQSACPDRTTDVSNAFAVAIRLHDVLGASLYETLHPDGSVADTYAELDTDDTSAQPATIESELYNASSPNAEHVPACLTIGLPSLPSTVSVDDNSVAQTITYKASAPIRTGNVTFSGLNLPGGKVGDPLAGTIHNIDASSAGFPSNLQLDLGTMSQGGSLGVQRIVDPQGPVKVQLWDVGPEPLAQTQTDTVSILSFDTPPTDGTPAEVITAQVTGLSSLVLTEPTPHSIDVASVFSVQQPWLRFDYANTKTDGTFTAIKGALTGAPGALLPIDESFDFNPESGIHVGWNSAAPAVLHLQSLVASGIQAGNIANTANDGDQNIGLGGDGIPGDDVDGTNPDVVRVSLPTSAQLCFGAHTQCGAGDETKVLGGLEVSLDDQVVLTSQNASGPIDVSGQFCLPNVFDDDCPRRIADGCCDGNDVLLINNLRFQNADLQFAKGESCQWNGTACFLGGLGSGPTPLHLVLKTDSTGLSIGHLEYDENTLQNLDGSLDVQGDSISMSSGPLGASPGGDTFDGISAIQETQNAVSLDQAPDPATGNPITLTGCGTINITYELFGVDNFGATSHAIPYADWCPGLFPVN